MIKNQELKINTYVNNNRDNRAGSQRLEREQKRAGALLENAERCLNTCWRKVSVCPEDDIKDQREPNRAGCRGGQENAGNHQRRTVFVQGDNTKLGH